MMNQEIKKMIVNKRFIIMGVIVLLITLPDLISNWFECLYPPHFIGVNNIIHPSKASFLSSNSIGHIPQIVIIWLLPIILLIMGCDSSNRETKLNIKNLYIIRKSRKSYYISKIVTSFFIPASTMFLIAVINWVSDIIIFRKGQNFCGLEQNLSQSDTPYLYFQIAHPYLTYFIYILTFSFVVGMCGILCQCLSILFSDIKKTYFVSFIIWILQSSFSPYLSNALQPFQETTLPMQIFAVLRLMIITAIVSIITMFIKRRKDEI